MPNGGLNGCVVILGYRVGVVGLVQLVIENSSVIITMDVVRGIYDDTSLVLLFDKLYRRKEDAVNEASYPAWKNQDKLVVDIGDDLLENCRSVKRDSLNVVIVVSISHVGAGTGVRSRYRGSVLEDVQGTAEVLNGVAP